MMDKRIRVVLLSAVMCVFLAACAKPFGSTDFEEVSGMGNMDDYVIIIPGQDNSTTTTKDNTTAGKTTSGKQTTTSGKQTTTSGKQTTATNDATGNSSATQSTTAQKPTDNTSDNSTTASTSATMTTTTVSEGIAFPSKGYVYEDEERLKISSIQVKGNKAILEIENVTKSYQTQKGSYVIYYCYDKDGKQLSTGQFEIDELQPGDIAQCHFTLHKDTVRVSLKWRAPMWSINYV